MNDNLSVEPVTPSAAPDANARTWCMLCHLSALLMLLSIPFANVLGPLIVWLVKKNEIPCIDAHGKAALNFQISMSIYMLVAAILCFFCIGIFLLIPLALTDIILSIIAAVQANDGKLYKYPLAIPFIK